MPSRAIGLGAGYCAPAEAGAGDVDGGAECADVGVGAAMVESVMVGCAEGVVMTVCVCAGSVEHQEEGGASRAAARPTTFYLCR